MSVLYDLSHAFLRPNLRYRTFAVDWSKETNLEDDYDEVNASQIYRLTETPIPSQLYDIAPRFNKPEQYDPEKRGPE